MYVHFVSLQIAYVSQYSHFIAIISMAAASETGQT